MAGVEKNRLSAYIPVVIVLVLSGLAFGAPARSGDGGGKKIPISTIDITLKYEKDCGKGIFDVHKMMESRRTKPKDPKIKAAMRHIVRMDRSAAANYGYYLACTGLVSAAPTACDDSKFLDGQEVPCREVQLLSMMAGEVLREKKNGMATCRKVVALLTDPPLAKPRAVAAICREMAGAMRSGKAQVLCARGSKLIVPGECAGYFSFMAGRPDRCGSLNDDGRRDFCIDLAKLISSLRSGRANACAASPLCSALTRRKTSACAPILARANKSFCKSIVAHGKVLKTEAARRAPEEAREEKVRTDQRKMVIERGGKAEALSEKRKVDDFKKSEEREAKRLRRLENIHRIKQRIREEAEARQYGNGERMIGHPSSVQDARRGRKSSRAGVERRIGLWEKKQAEKKEEEGEEN